MVRKPFEASFERLRAQSNKLADVPRDPEHLDEIVAERVELDDIRDQTRAERKKIVSHYEYPAPDVVERPRGYLHTSRIGKIGAAISAALLAVIVGLVVFGVVLPVTSGPLQVGNVVETLEPDCSWQVEATIRNDSDQTYELTGFETVLDRQMIKATPLEMPTLGPGEQATASAVWGPGFVGACTSTDAVDHGNLVVRFVRAGDPTNFQSTVSHSF